LTGFKRGEGLLLDPKEKGDRAFQGKEEKKGPLEEKYRLISIKGKRREGPL